MNKQQYRRQYLKAEPDQLRSERIRKRVTALITGITMALPDGKKVKASMLSDAYSELYFQGIKCWRIKGYIEGYKKGFSEALALVAQNEIDLQKVAADNLRKVSS